MIVATVNNGTVRLIKLVMIHLVCLGT